VTRSGIYAIRHLASGKVYVGSAADIRGRHHTHRYFLRRGDHHSILLQRAWDKYGEVAFEFVTLEAVAAVDDLVRREQYWIDALGSAEPARGYNIVPIARSWRGMRHSPEARAKMSAERKARGPEWRAKLSAARRGRKHSAETIAKMRGQKRTAETRENIGKAQRGRAKSAEQRAKISATLRGRSLGPQSSETIAKRVAATRATKLARKAVPQ
jgi:group I intron endonuclease